MLSLWLNKCFGYKEQEKSADDTGNNLGEEVRDILRFEM